LFSSFFIFSLRKIKMSNYYGYPNGYAQASYNAQQHQAWMTAAAAAGYPSYSAAPQSYSDAYKAMQQANLAAQQQTNLSTQHQNKSTQQHQQQPYDYSQYAASYYAANTASTTNAYDTALYSAAGVLMAQNTPTWPVAPLPVPPPPPPPSSSASSSLSLPLSSGHHIHDHKKVPFKRRMATSNMQLYYCEVCKISCAGPSTYKEHLEGQKHKKREQAMKKAENKRGNQSQIHCDLCDVNCTGKDAYLAHIRGSKHQKTVKLHQKLGKPIPDVASVLAKAQSQSNGITISAPPMVISKTPITRCKFIAGSTLKTLTNEGDEEKHDELSIASTNETNTSIEHQQQQLHDEQQELDTNNGDFDFEPDVEPVGREYIELKHEGKILTFHCKLCECKFNDPNAKEMHLKGRRHRLAYKKKVDPSLKVDFKSNTKKNAIALKREKLRQRMEERRAAQVAHRMPLMSINQRRNDSYEDRHVMAKHSAIYPTNEEINVIQDLVTSCEKALKLVSDEIAAEETNKLIDESTHQQEQEKEQQIQQPPVIKPLLSLQLDEPQPNQNRTLKGVMRVGLLAKGLLLRGDSEVQLVVLCTNKPTKTLFNRVFSLLNTKLPLVTQTQYSIVKDIIEECIHVKTTIEPIINCRIYMTSPACRQENQTIESIIKQGF
jgi:zinc finger RNA-binding protein